MLTQKYSISIRDVDYLEQYRLAKEMNGMSTKVGFPKGKSPASGDDSMADLATRAYYFHKGIKTKSGVKVWDFLGITYEREKDSIEALLKEFYIDVVNRHKTGRQALGIIGEYLTKETQQTIRDMDAPALEANTVKQKKGSGKVMIGDGQMWQSITHKEGRR